MRASSQENTVNCEATAIPYRMQLVPHKLLALLLLHGFAIWGLLTLHQLKWQTHLFTSTLSLLAAMGVQVGAHRLWAHRAFTATTGLRLFLALCFTIAFQEDLFTWTRDHRCHHKWTDTDADPYNARRGFLFSHLGWIVQRKHPQVRRKGRTIDMRDIEGQPIVAFHRRWYYALLLLIWGLLPTAIPAYLWGERPTNALLCCVFLRTVTFLHGTWLVNSWAHRYGSRPYDTRLTAVESNFRHLVLGEGFHNYHHAFPWDYSASELGPRDVFNPATVFIDFCHWMGWASALKRADASLVQQKRETVGGGEDLKAVKGNFTREWLAGWMTYFGISALLPLAISHLIQYALGGA